MCCGWKASWERYEEYEIKKKSRSIACWSLIQALIFGCLGVTVVMVFWLADATQAKIWTHDREILAGIVGVCAAIGLAVSFVSICMSTCCMCFLKFLNLLQILMNFTYAGMLIAYTLFILLGYVPKPWSKDYTTEGYVIFGIIGSVLMFSFVKGFWDNIRLFQIWVSVE